MYNVVSGLVSLPGHRDAFNISVRRKPSGFANRRPQAKPYAVAMAKPNAFAYPPAPGIPVLPSPGNSSIVASYENVQVRCIAERDILSEGACQNLQGKNKRRRCFYLVASLIALGWGRVCILLARYY